MPEDACQCLGIHTALRCVGRKGMAQVVKSNQRKLGVFQYHLQLAVGCLRVYRLFGIQERREYPLGDCRLLSIFQQFSHTRR